MDIKTQKQYLNELKKLAKINRNNISLDQWKKVIITQYSNILNKYSIKHAPKKVTTLTNQLNRLTTLKCIEENNYDMNDAMREKYNNFRQHRNNEHLVKIEVKNHQLISMFNKTNDWYTSLINNIKTKIDNIEQLQNYQNYQKNIKIKKVFKNCLNKFSLNGENNLNQARLFYRYVKFNYPEFIHVIKNPDNSLTQRFLKGVNIKNSAKNKKFKKIDLIYIKTHGYEQWYYKPINSTSKKSSLRLATLQNWKNEFKSINKL